MRNKKYIINKLKKQFYNLFYYYVFDKLITSQKGYIFEFLFNLRSLIFRLGVRAKYEGNIYKFNDLKWPNKSVYAFHENNASYSFGKGIVNRVKDLEKAYMLNLIDFSKRDIVFDCGANNGDLKLFFDFYNIGIKYFAFEPSPIEYEVLKRNIYPHTAFNVGLWKEPGFLNFYVSSQSADSSFIEPVNYEKIIKVKAETLSSYVENKKIKLLKLEAEGAEPEILMGLSDKLENIEYLSADLGYERGKSKESTLVAVTNYLLNRNFELIEVSPIRLCALYKNKLFN